MPAMQTDDRLTPERLAKMFGGVFRVEEYRPALAKALTEMVIELLSPVGVPAGQVWEQVAGYSHRSDDWCEPFLEWLEEARAAERFGTSTAEASV